MVMILSLIVGCLDCHIYLGSDSRVFKYYPAGKKWGVEVEVSLGAIEHVKGWGQRKD